MGREARKKSEQSGAKNTIEKKLRLEKKKKKKTFEKK